MSKLVKARCAYCRRRMRKHAAAVLGVPVVWAWTRDTWYSMAEVHAECWRAIKVAERIAR